MDRRNAGQWIVAIVILLADVAVSPPGYAGPVYIYHADFDLPIPSPDEPESELGKGWMADAVINITDHISISDLDVTIGLDHESLFDLQIILQSPAGTNLVLNLAGNPAFIVRDEDGRLTPVGGSIDLFFDDEANLSIEEATEPFNQPFRPVSSLSLLDQQDSFGQWRLRIYDAFYADTGTLNSFDLIITAPEPAAAILLMLGTGLLTLFRSRHTP